MPPGDKSVVLISRALWSFSEAYRRYPDPAYQKMAAACSKFLRDKMWDKQRGGYYFMVSREGNVIRSVLKKFWPGGATGVPARPLRRLGVVQSEETEGTCPLPTAGLVISERKFQRHLPYPAITGASNLAEVAVDFAGD